MIFYLFSKDNFTSTQLLRAAEVFFSCRQLKKDCTYQGLTLNCDLMMNFKNWCWLTHVYMSTAHHFKCVHVYYHKVVTASCRFKGQSVCYLSSLVRVGSIQLC